MMLVAGAKETGRTAEQAFAAAVPADPLAGLEGIANLWLVEEWFRHQNADPAHEEGAIFIGQSHLPLGLHRKFFRSGVIFDIARCGLGREPLADIAFAGIGCLSEFSRAERTFGRERFVEAELVADQHQ